MSGGSGILLSSYVITLLENRYFHDDSLLSTLSNGALWPGAPHTKHDMINIGLVAWPLIVRVKREVISRSFIF